MTHTPPNCVLTIVSFLFCYHNNFNLVGFSNFLKIDIQRHMIIYCTETLTFFVFFAVLNTIYTQKKYLLYSVHMYVQIIFTNALRPHTFDPLCDEREKCKLQGNIDHFSLLTECGFISMPEKVWVPSLYRHEYTNCGAKLEKVTDCFRGS